jgi:transglutaminase-like putative cysteine protease
MKYFLPYLLLLITTIATAQNAKPRSGKAPAWVTVNNLDYTNPKLEADAEDGYFDLAFEKQVSVGEQSRYFRKAMKILSEAGVQNASEISVNFDPTYQSLTFHTVRIFRDGQVLNRLQLSKFKTIQEEKDLGKHLYDGSLTALLVVDDVRKGDVLEFSYTIKGFNPIFEGKYADSYDLQFGVPIGLLYYKLILPANRNIITKNSNTNIAATIYNTPKETIYEWNVVSAPALRLETKTPGWYDPYPEVLISEYKSWNEVGSWAAKLFPDNAALSPGLQKKINSIKESCPTPEAKIIAALRFVQDDIRYMGIEMGISSHKPSHPDKIFNQRFGDCKDKSYLLVTMLRAMDIEANPVLINTVAKKTIFEWLPAANVFDHVTVQVKLANKVYYFDPTISFQRGTIDNISYPDYQSGLVINESTTALTTIPFSEKGFVDIREVIDVPDMTGRARLKVITTRTGSYADEARYDYNNYSLYEIKNKYKDFYAGFFKNIVVDSLTYNDDVKGGFTTTEYYTLKDIWKDDGDKKKIPLDAYVINSLMSKPTDENRKMPFYLSYPMHYKEHVEVNMPEDWSATPYNTTVTSPGFKLTASAGCTGNKILLNYEYETLKDFVAPGEASAFFTRFDEAYASTDYDITYKQGDMPSVYNTSNTDATTSSVFPKLYLLLGLCVLITFLVRSNRQKQI